VFNEGLERAARYGGLDRYRALGKRHLIALDGVWFYQSENIKCGHCLRQQKKGGEALYCHDMIAAVLMKPGLPTVLSLNPGFIRNEGGKEKRDCGREAAKRRISGKAEGYRWLNPVFLGDDLYSHYPVCAAIVEKGMHFIFTRKPDSHQRLYGSIDSGCMKGKTVRKWTGREHLEYRFRRYNGVGIREEKPVLTVNIFSLEIWNGKKGKAAYSNSWITNLEVDEKNIAEMAECVRAGWKIENEHHNVLKHHRYHLEHNFGHGQENACEIYALLNLSAFQTHGILLLLDEGYQKARASIRRLDEFFDGLRLIFSRFLFQTWEGFIGFIVHDDEPGG
jgi:hypothetical protein